MALQSYENIQAPDVLAAMVRMAKDHGVLYVASPCKDNEYFSVAGMGGAWRTPIVYCNDAEFDLVPVETELVDANSKMANLLIYEAYASLIDAGLCDFETPCPIDIENGAIIINPASTIPLSVYLLSADRTIEKLANLAAEHEFCEGKAVSPLWLQRTLSDLIDEPTDTMKPALSMTMV